MLKLEFLLRYNSVQTLSSTMNMQNDLLEIAEIYEQ